MMEQSLGLKVFGLQRSGTTYLRDLLKHNFELPVFTNELGWKHGEVIDPGPAIKKRKKPSPYTKKFQEEVRKANSVIALIIIKNPYTWFPSILRWYRKAWKIHAEAPQGYFDLYNSRYEHYWNFKESPTYCYKKVLIVRYEDLLSNLEEQMLRISSESGCKILRCEDINKVNQSQPFDEVQREFYLNPKRNKAVMDLINWEIIGKYGYTK